MLLRKMKHVNVKLKRDVYMRLRRENPKLKEEYVAWGYASKVVTSFPESVSVHIVGVA